MLRIVCVLIATGGLLLAAYVWMRGNPEVVFLADENGAQWIRYDEPVQLNARPIQKRIVGFRKTFHVAFPPDRAMLDVRGLRFVDVFVDGKIVFSAPRDPVEWTHRYEIDLAPRLTPGQHEIYLLATNGTGPPCVLAHSETLGIRTGADWEATIDGKRWTPAWPATQVRASALSHEFPRADVAFLSSLRVLGPVFLIVFLVVALGKEGGVKVTPVALRWFLLGAWALLGINNLAKLPLYLGFDAAGHLDYIRLVAEQHRLPLPTEGWTMFQAPLYYLISASLYTLCLQLFQPETARRLLSLVPLASGLAAVEFSYRILRWLWPGDAGRQRAGLLFAALCPMSLYLSPFLGNEMLSALLLAVVLVLAMRLVHDPVASTQRRLPLLIGGVLGLALLTKLTAIVLTAPILIAVAWARWRTSEGTSLRRAGRALQTVAGVACIVLLVAGWFYSRNWIVSGRHMYTGAIELGVDWWQDPGYRTWRQLLGFGEALRYPINSSLISFLDGFYSSFSLDAHLSSMIVATARPPWNLDFLLAGAWWGLVPVALMGIGLLSVIRPENAGMRRVLLLSGACLAALWVAMVYGFLRVPYYCVVKATYTLGLLPCYAVLVAAGFGVLTRGRISRAVVYGLLSCWGLCAYLAYWVV